MKYCLSCGQNVQPTKKFSIVWFLINCLWLVGGFVYILYYLIFKKKTCPICYGNQLTKMDSSKNIPQSQVSEFNAKADDWISKRKAEIETMKEQRREKNFN